jgi:inhibitor of cysteine peptidase
MKMRIILVLVMLIASISLLSCIVTSHDFSVEISCDQFGDNNHGSDEFEVEVGDKIRVRLCSNPTTGFEWAYETTGQSVLQEEDYDFEEPEGDTPGAAGIEAWTFEATEKGTAEVRMEYSQPWEGGEKEEWTFTLSVTVK